MQNIPGLILLSYLIFATVATIILLRWAYLKLRYKSGKKISLKDFALYTVFCAGIGTIFGFGFHILSFLLWLIFGRET